jgi:DNA repair exonuclease SbcCD ATPase subunit
VAALAATDTPFAHLDTAMTSLTHPADYSVAELREELEAVDDAAELERLRDVEEDGENRVTALEAIEQRLAELEPAGDPDDADADAEEDADEDEDEAEAADDEPAADGVDDDAADDGAGAIEETWSKDTGRDDQESPPTGRPAEVADEPPSPPADVVREREAGPREPRDRPRFSRDDAGYGGGRVEARIRQLQTEVGDLKAYRSALEEFLDEEGTGRQVIESLRADLASVEADIAELAEDATLRERDLGELWGVIGDVENELSQLADLLNRQHRDLEDVAADVESLDGDLRSVRETADERHADHADRFDAVDDRLDDHAGALDEVRDEVTAVSEHAEGVAADLRELDAAVDERFDEASAAHAELSDRIDANADAIEALTAQVDDIAADVETLTAAVGDAGQVDERFDDVEGEIQALKEWREQLSSVLLGSAGEPGATEQ